MTLRKLRLVAMCLLMTPTLPASEAWDQFWEDMTPDVYGFHEVRAGYRLQNGPHQKDMSIMEARTQLDLQALPPWATVSVKGDAYVDSVMERGEFDLREANISMTPLDFMDLKVGRQILTWGKGDLLFINDLFPKDWQSFFIGRDTEYLKAPSDAIKMGLFSDEANLEIVYTPEFDSDRYITGERLSYWSGSAQQIVGQNADFTAQKPRGVFQEDEVAARLYQSFGGAEVALYGYWGYWKSPGGYNNAQTHAIFPSLDVYGASLERPVGPGILAAEIGYYNSRDDTDGTNGLVNNSEMRYLLGYNQEIARDFTAGVQYYIEQMLDYQEYLGGVGAGSAVKDEFRHLVSLRLTRLLMNQNLTCSLFTYYSPTDEDAHFRPNIRLKVNDQAAVEVGANVFVGDEDHTFFGQFQTNTNAYVSVRYSF
ncbi:MAG: hypothetical protein GY809_10975 [Planctomycetes bacterium]|nr:hypothetical protein [Planctomycetota bacterium]